MNKSSLLFLDIDGVLNSDNFLKEGLKKNLKHSYGDVGDGWENAWDSVWEIDDRAVELLNKIIVKTDCKIVLSSSWRFNWTLNNFIKMLRCHNFKFDKDVLIGMTPLVDLSYRGAEIQKWIDENKFEGRFAIVDDNDDMKELKSHLFLTTFDEGLTEDIAESIIKYFNDPNIVC